MRIFGKWTSFDDGERRPTIRVEVQDKPRQWLPEEFLLDLGADRTVIGYGLRTNLSISQVEPDPPVGLGGIGGQTDYVILRTKLRLSIGGKSYFVVPGEYPAFTDPWAGNMSLLGRDILDHFDVIVPGIRVRLLCLAGGIVTGSNPSDNA